MGLFSKKPQTPDYDKAECATKKLKMREIFDKVVENGSSYEILYAYMSKSKFEQGFVMNTTTTTFYHYIVGYRSSDFDMIFVQIDSELKEHSTAFHVDMDKVVNVSYDPKICQIAFKYEKNYGSYGELLKVGDTGKKTTFGPKNIYQPEERERFLDFAERFRSVLEQKGYKLDKWKR